MVGLAAAPIFPTAVLLPDLAVACCRFNHFRRAPATRDKLASFLPARSPAALLLLPGSPEDQSIPDGSCKPAAVKNVLVGESVPADPRSASGNEAEGLAFVHVFRGGILGDGTRSRVTMRGFNSLVAWVQVRCAAGLHLQRCR